VYGASIDGPLITYSLIYLTPSVIPLCMIVIGSYNRAHRLHWHYKCIVYLTKRLVTT